MVDTNWMIKGVEFNHCNCAYGCPCQFNALPTYGNCCAVIGIAIEDGHHGTTKLDGLNIAAVLAWPRAVHEGKGQYVPIVDERATPEQREALLRIMGGHDTEPGATFFQVFSTTYEKIHEPVFAKIELEIDVDTRNARLIVPGVLDARGEPLVNPITKQPHRARINLPAGFEYIVAEIGRGWADSSGAIALHLKDSHAHFAHLHMTQDGVVR